jgi:hypothetical protein
MNQNGRVQRKSTTGLNGRSLRLTTSDLMLPFTVTRPVTIQEISIILDPRDTKLDSGRELTNGNPSRLGLCRIKIRRSFLLKRSKRRSCLDPESEQAI